MTTTRPDFAQEWTTLQNNHERYESGALLLKLAGVAVFGLGVAATHAGLLVALLVALIWGVEAIHRAFQSRLGERILRIESLLRSETPEGTAFQLHSEWLAARPGTAGLLLEYGKSALRPTVAFPYALMLAALALHRLM